MSKSKPSDREFEEYKAPKLPPKKKPRKFNHNQLRQLEVEDLEEFYENDT